MKNMTQYAKIAFILVLIGGINWGLVGLFKFNLIGVILGGSTGLGIIARLVYFAVGVAAGYLIYLEYVEYKGKV